MPEERLSAAAELLIENKVREIETRREKSGRIALGTWFTANLIGLLALAGSGYFYMEQRITSMLSAKVPAALSEELDEQRDRMERADADVFDAIIKVNQLAAQIELESKRTSELSDELVRRVAGLEATVDSQANRVEKEVIEGRKVVAELESLRENIGSNMFLSELQSVAAIVEAIGDSPDGKLLANTLERIEQLENPGLQDLAVKSLTVTDEEGPGQIKLAAGKGGIAAMSFYSDLDVPGVSLLSTPSMSMVSLVNADEGVPYVYIGAGQSLGGIIQLMDRNGSIANSFVAPIDPKSSDRWKSPF